MKAQWNWRDHFHIVVLPPTPCSAKNHIPIMQGHWRLWWLQILVFITGCLMSPQSMLPLWTQHKEIPIQGRYVSREEIWKNLCKCRIIFSCFLWSVVVWERGNMQRKQRNCFLSPNKEKQGAVWYLSHREGWHTLKVRIIPPLTHFIWVVKT